MKKIATLILFITSSYIVFSQEKPLEYTAEVPVINTTAKELHDRCITWISKSLNSSEKILLQSADDKIIANPCLIYYPNFVSGSHPVIGKITYNFEVKFNDGKFTYILNNFVHHGNPDAVYHPINFGLITTAQKSPLKFPNQLLSERAWKDIKYQITDQIIPLIANLKTEMTKAPEK